VTEVFKIAYKTYDAEVSPNLKYYPKSSTRGNKCKLLNQHFTMIYENILSPLV